MSIADYHVEALTAVAKATGVAVEDIQGKCRLRHLVDARCMVAMLLWRQGYSTKEIAGQLGVSIRWIQMVVKSFRDRVRYSGDDRLRSNWEELTK